MGEPTVYKFPRKSLVLNQPKGRDQHLWEKHQQKKNNAKVPGKR